MSKPENSVAVMDLYVGPDSKVASGGARTPLAHVGLPVRGGAASVSRIARGKAASRTVAPSVMLEEAELTGILVLRASSASVELDNALRSTLKLDLPGRLESRSEGKRYCIRWMSPDEWLLTCPLNEAFDVERKLRAAVEGPVAVVDVSGGYELAHFIG